MLPIKTLRWNFPSICLGSVRPPLLMAAGVICLVNLTPILSAQTAGPIANPHDAEIRLLCASLETLDPQSAEVAQLKNVLAELGCNDCADQSLAKAAIDARSEIAPSADLALKLNINPSYLVAVQESGQPAKKSEQSEAKKGKRDQLKTDQEKGDKAKARGERSKQVPKTEKNRNELGTTGIKQAELAKRKEKAARRQAELKTIREEQRREEQRREEQRREEQRERIERLEQQERGHAPHEEGFEQRLRHMHEAAEHLELAGAHELVQEVHRAIDELHHQREHAHGNAETHEHEHDAADLAQAAGHTHDHAEERQDRAIVEMHERLRRLYMEVDRLKETVAQLRDDDDDDDDDDDEDHDDDDDDHDHDDDDDDD